ncbi:hypothetical protein GCK72_010208 [Caenorhabditis remanei]|uniref:RRM domain-containing protein n=1 Tax=Caenorhabditis remanei TaxID=31234 RepID=A0A6A5H4K7_CAERE|nr:hypothetical protein GCK72_010208 [Caenorhabditis remanei]KAF1761949.1 hypothetical protein GCK72_010208 [Caenorhabditis remanei]
MPVDDYDALGLCPVLQNSRGRSRSPSKSPEYRRERENSRSRSPRPRYGGGGRGRGGGGGGGGQYDRENPPPSKCLGVFNLSSYTTDKDLRDVFGEFGEIDKCDLVYDRPSGNSRGFGFIYFKLIEDATAAREKLCNTDLDGHKIRVDYSFTKRGHSPTPGQYMGDRRGGGRDRFNDRGGRGGGDRYGGDRHDGDRYGGDRYGGDRFGGAERHGGGDRFGGGRRGSPERRYGGGGFRSGGGGSGFMRNGGGPDRRDHRDRESDRNGGSGGHRPYDPQFRRRVESYGSGGQRRNDRY